MKKQTGNSEISDVFSFVLVLVKINREILKFQFFVCNFTSWVFWPKKQKIWFLIKEKRINPNFQSCSFDQKRYKHMKFMLRMEFQKPKMNFLFS